MYTSENWFLYQTSRTLEESGASCHKVMICSENDGTCQKVMKLVRNDDCCQNIMNLVKQMMNHDVKGLQAKMRVRTRVRRPRQKMQGEMQPHNRGNERNNGYAGVWAMGLI